MKRRQFIRNTGAVAAAAGLMPAMGMKGLPAGTDPELLQSTVLKGFRGEQEEYPSIVSDGEGNLWMFSLRRLRYPEDRELVSAFRYTGSEWVEIDPVTRNAGRFEAPAASCPNGGSPVVAWCSIENGTWNIRAARWSGNGFGEPEKLPNPSGKPINPVVLAAADDRTWIAWEVYEKGRFRIHISKYENGAWSDPAVIQKEENSCFTPAMAEAGNGDLYVAFGVTSGCHQNIEMTILDGGSMQAKKSVDIAVGGGWGNRVNLNTHPALAFDKTGRLWISYENNRHTNRLDDGDNYTGDRYCAILTYKDGRIVEPAQTGRWLFRDMNDHAPSFFKDLHGNLFIATHCGGYFIDGVRIKTHTWRYRLSWLDPEKGWADPVTLLETHQKGPLVPPIMAADRQNRLWLATSIEKTFDPDKNTGFGDAELIKLDQLAAYQYSMPTLGREYRPMTFRETRVAEHLPELTAPFQVSGHPKITGVKRQAGGEQVSLVYGNLHEHSEISPCWPAGTDGTLHEDYRFGMYAEGYDFIGMTDHGYSLPEVRWRKSLRLADYYNDPPWFVALPAMEWTVSAQGNLEEVPGAGHYNVVFAGTETARDFVRNQYEVFSRLTPETDRADRLWELLEKRNIDCITIPHHPADERHPVDWEMHSDTYVPVVELFQCRGNAEYPGCPREINLDRHRTTPSKRAFVDYALKEKGYKMGFIASGDHNSMGVGVAALWVKTLSRDGILEAMRSRRCFATTGDKIIMEFRVNGALNGATVTPDGNPEMDIRVNGERDLYKVELLRNSEVIRTWYTDREKEFSVHYTDTHYREAGEVCYYYARATQRDNQIAWSSPVWIDMG